MTCRRDSGKKGRSGFQEGEETKALAIDVDLPWGRVLSGEEAQAADAAEVGAACRMALLLLVAHEAGTLLHEGEARLSASCDERGTRYAVFDAEGEPLDEGDDWAVLSVRLDSTAASGANPVIDASTVTASRA